MLVSRELRLHSVRNTAANRQRREWHTFDHKIQDSNQSGALSTTANQNRCSFSRTAKHDFCQKQDLVSRSSPGTTPWETWVKVGSLGRLFQVSKVSQGTRPLSQGRIFPRSSVPTYNGCRDIFPNCEKDIFSRSTCVFPRSKSLFR